MKIFNKVLTLALVCALLFGFIPGAKAQAHDTTLLSQPLLDKTLDITAIAAHRGVLYIKAQTGLYRYAPGEEKAVLLLERSDTYSASENDPDYFDLLLSDGETLYAMNNTKGTLRQVTLKGDTISFGELKQLDWSSFLVEENEYNYTNAPFNLLLSEGFLYLLSNDNMGGMTAMRVSLQSGEIQTFEDLKNIKKLTTYKDDKLLALLYDDETGYDPQTGKSKPPDLAIFDPQMETLDPIGPLMDGMEGYWSSSMAYDAAQDKLYFTDKNIIYYRKALGEPTACAYLPSDMSYAAALPLHLFESGRLAALTYAGIALREDNLDGLKDVKTLVIAGYSDNDMINRIAARMPEVRIDSQSVHYDTNEDLVQAMLSRSDDADILWLDTRMHQVNSFLQKGYALELPADGEAAKATAAMYPMLSSLAMVDGKIFALPAGLEFTVDMVAPELFKKVGMQVPEDFFSLCHSLQMWANETHEKFPEYTYWRTFNNKGMLYDLAFEVYRNALRAEGEDLRFDTKLFRNMMARIEEMDTQAIDVQFDWQSPDAAAQEEELYSKIALADRWYGFTPDMAHKTIQLETSQDMTLFAAEPGGKKVTTGDVSLMVINPFSKNPEAALRFIELYAASLPQMTKVRLMPGENEAILNPRYEEQTAEITESIKSLQQQAVEQHAKGLPAGEIEAYIAAYQNVLKDAETTIRYLLTEDDIYLVRQIIDMVFIPTALNRLEDRADIYPAFNQLKEGTLSLDQFIKEADNKLRLVRLENQ